MTLTSSVPPLSSGSPHGGPEITEQVTMDLNWEAKETFPLRVVSSGIFEVAMKTDYHSST